MRETELKKIKLNNRYVLIEEIGKGGFGTVYKAFDILLNCYVAMKEFKTDERMVYEARIMKALRNVPYIARYKDYFEENGKSYIVMKLLKGQSLSDALKSRRKLKVQDLLLPLENIIIAMSTMHELGFIHRDISPGNLFFTEDGELILIDFGTATAIDPSSELYNTTFFEHKGFQSPENKNIAEQGPWTDIYSFCSTVFYLITGEGVLEPENRVLMDNVPRALLRSMLSAKQQNAIISGLQIDYTKRCNNAELLRLLLFGEDKNKYEIKSVAFSAGTNIGSRAVNQDNIMVDGLFYFEGRDFIKSGTIECKTNELHMVAVCDGVGGANCGELASRAIAQALNHFLEQQRYSKKLPERLLEELLDQINEKIISLGNKIGQTGSTVSLMLWKNNEYYVANIGDSPIFLLRKRKLIRLSIEQTLSFVKHAEGIPSSIKERHTLVNYMGKPNVAGSQMMSYRHGYIKKGDTFFLCSDGITNKIENDRLKRYLLKDNSRAIDKIYRVLSKKTNKDNCTGAIIKF